MQSKSIDSETWNKKKGIGVVVAEKMEVGESVGWMKEKGEVLTGIATSHVDFIYHITV